MDNSQLRPTHLSLRYLVDNTGVIYSSKDKKPKTTHINGSGYRTVNLYLPELRPNKNPWSRQLVHRIVAGTFLGNIENMVVNHKDGVKTNNSVENLEIVTYSENVEHAYKLGLNKCKGDTHHNAKLDSKKVHEICRLIVETDLFYREIAKKYNVSYSAINNIAQKHRWKEISDIYWVGKVQRLANRNRDKRKT